MTEKQHLKYLVKAAAGLHVMWLFKFKLSKEVVDRDLFNRRGFFAFLIGFYRLFFWWMDRCRKIFVSREPQAVMEIIKRADTRGVPNGKAGKDCMKMVFLEVSSPCCIGRYPAYYGKQDGAEHIRGKSWGRPEVRIAVAHKGINL